MVKVQFDRLLQPYLQEQKDTIAKQFGCNISMWVDETTPLGQQLLVFIGGKNPHDCGEYLKVRVRTLKKPPAQTTHADPGVIMQGTEGPEETLVAPGRVAGGTDYGLLGPPTNVDVVLGLNLAHNPKKPANKRVATTAHQARVTGMGRYCLLLSKETNQWLSQQCPTWLTNQ
jgi:hypothetical protein